MFSSDHSSILLVLLHSVGGADITSAIMAFWALAMLAYPETQARAHAQLDAVVGRPRLPTFAGYQHLPYIRAMIKELFTLETSRSVNHATSEHPRRLVRRDISAQRHDLHRKCVAHEPRSRDLW
jgi:cytochrome P450